MTNAKNFVINGFENMIQFVANLPARVIDAISSLPGKIIDWAKTQGLKLTPAIIAKLPKDVDGFFLEYDDARSGDFAPLRFVPKGNLRIVLGVVTSKFGKLEDKGSIKKRLEEASKYMPLEQMCLSAQCGFASHTGGNLLSEQEQAAKIRHIVEIADEVWKGWR